MSQQAILRRRKVKLYNRNPYCSYCKERMILAFPSDGHVPWDAATSEHLQSRLQGRKTKRPTTNVILVCRRCNEYRGWLEQHIVPPWVLFWRSKDKLDWLFRRLGVFRFFWHVVSWIFMQSIYKKRLKKLMGIWYNEINERR